jgi:hypothetical protein
MAHYLALAGRPVAVVNLDPAADPPAGEEDAPFAVDVRDLVDLSAVMAAHALGPNGGLLFCVDHLAENVDWLIDAVAPLVGGGDGGGRYVIFDTPGQAELTAPGSPLHTVLAALHSRLHLSLVSVMLLDSHLCADAGKFLGGCLTALTAQLALGLPHVAALTKVDLLRNHALGSGLDFDLAFYARPFGLRRLAAAVAARSGGAPAFAARHARLTSLLCDVVDDYALLSFTPLAIEDEACVARCAALCDRAGGYAPGAAGGGVALPIGVAELDWGGDDLLAALQFKYLDAGEGEGGGEGAGSDWSESD